MPNSVGDPQNCRSISRELKRGRKGEELLGSARSMKDPYYRSIALVEIGLKGSMHEDRAGHILEEALKEASSVTSEWRRGELLGEILHQANRSEDPRKNAQLTRGSLDLLRAIPSGHGLSEGIKACAKSADAVLGMELLVLALDNRGFELENGKSVIKAIFRDKGPSPETVEAMERTLERRRGDLTRTLLFSYLFLQLDQASRGEEAKRTFRSAVSLLSELKDQELLQAFNDLARKASSVECLDHLLEIASSEGDPYVSVKMLSVISDSMDRLGEGERAHTVLMSALERTSLVPMERRGEVLASCSNAFRRLGDGKRADELSQKAQEMAESDDAASRKVKRVLGLEKGTGPGAAPRENAPKSVGRKNHVLALCDTYEGRLGPVHLRALARAAPLCWAYSLDLALIGFPTNDMKRLADLSVNETSVGEEGKYIRMLAEKGRMVLVPCSKDAPPSVWSGLGLPVATTPHPDNLKALDMKGAVNRALSHPSGRVCLIMGLGKRGLPPSLLRSVPHHLELTGSNISLETATAMGIMAYMLYLSTDMDD
ncbi:MAG: DUF531 family protein [Candidatus Thermoplasmatota archaeon]|jgi:hypothetical protein|nr:DUF531 family protein [Candidatus Thermoplasmatota archaeon]